MYTLGFAFKPWLDAKAIADGPSIINYLNETIDELDLKKHIRLNHKVSKLAWSSGDNTWTLDLAIEDKPSTLTCQYIFMCTGYYNYDQGFTPEFKNVENYNGTFIHPQFWPEDLDYTNKRIVIIGSGATAVTLVPELAKKAAHVTMLQRSPTFITVAPAQDKIANLLNSVLPNKLAYKLNRSRKIRVGNFFYKFAKKYPVFMANLMKKGVKKELGDLYDIEKHFTPKYNPWDQRICLAPDSDFFNALKSGKATVVTDTIDSFTADGLSLDTEDNLLADIVVSATGLELQFFGGMDVVIDGETIDYANLVAYKGAMFSGIPNLTLAFGYTNASWTLKCDLSNDYFARIIQYMTNEGYESCRPILSGDIGKVPFVDFNSSYFLRYLDDLPKQGDVEPWKLKQDYFVDLKKLKYGKLDDGVLQFTSSSHATRKESVNEMA